MKTLLSFILTLLPLFISAQTISGKITCGKENTGGISVLLHQPKTFNKIIAFDISRNNGEFSIKYESNLDSLEITTRSINFKDTSICISNKNQFINLDIIAELHNLNEVFVKASPINFKKDTIVYNVGVFSKENDKSIGDVINKMPGFEVLDNGAINYQGKKIEKYYIEGLDLLEGKYGIANNNLSHQSVRTVEVLQNHQPIKLLDTLVFTDKTSINIRLQRNLNLAGRAKIGAGASPLLWDSNISPMLFNKNQQMIASYQCNNIGKDISQQLIPHYFSEMKNSEKEELLNILPLASPKIKKNRYLDNNIHLATYNHIIKLNNDKNIKINTSYVNDYQKQEGLIKNTYFLKDDTITTFENTSNQIGSDQLTSDLIYNENSNKRFLKNKLSIIKHWDINRGHITNNYNRINQNAKLPYILIGNHLKWIVPIKHKLLTIKSEVTYNESPQSLKIYPGIFPAIINQDKEYNKTEQHTKLNRFTSKNLFQISFNKKNWHLDNTLGVEYEKDRLTSQINIDEIKKQDQLFQNHLIWNSYIYYLSECLRYKTPNLNISINVPVKNISNRTKDSYASKKSELTKTVATPSLYINYKITGNLTYTIRFLKDNEFSNISDINYAYLLKNYRTLVIKDLPIEEKKIYGYNTLLKYTNPIGSWFASVFFNQTKTKNNTLISQTVKDDGSSEYSASLKDNNNYQTNIYFKGSKLLYDLGSTIFINSTYHYTKSKMLSNSLLTNIHYKYFLLEPRISFSKLKWMLLDYKFQYSKSIQEISSSKSTFTNRNHITKLNLFPIPNHSLGAEFEYYQTKTSSKNNTQFTNINYTWKPKNTKMTLELKCMNLFNDDNFTSYYNNNISTIKSTINIRQRQFIFSIDFRL